MRRAGGVISIVLLATGIVAACSDLDGLSTNDVADGGDAATGTSDATSIEDTGTSSSDAANDVSAPMTDGGCTTTPFVTAKTADPSDASIPWTAAPNALTFDGGAATYPLKPAETSPVLSVKNFAFGVPASASVTGITVTIVRHEDSLASVVDAEIILGTTATGPSASFGKSSGWPNTPTAATYGGPSEDWGLVLTPAVVNAQDFSVSLSARQLANGATTLHVDSIAVSVRYCE